VDGVPVRFFRGEAEDPTPRTLRRQEAEAEQLCLALGADAAADGLVFRLAVETGEDGAVSRIVFLALRGEEGHAECFWPVPLERKAAAAPGPRTGRERHNNAPALQLPAAGLSRSSAGDPPRARADNDQRS
jgi:hypothetical protein